jgi:4-azaleucine resistance transporter AzlC
VTESREAPVTFTVAGFALGVRRSLPLQIGMIPFGLVVGVTAQAQGLSVLEALLMSGLVVAGASQLVVLGAWAMPVSLVSATLTCFVMNLRFGLMGPTLAPWLDKVHGWKRWGSIYLLMDHVWALSLQELARGGRDAAFMLGIGLVSWIIWVVCTVLGFVLGEMVHPAAGHPLFFAALAAFIAMLVPMWRGRHRDLLPWIAAAATAVGVAKLLPGTSWHIVAGAIVGGVTGYLRDRKRDADAVSKRGAGASSVRDADQSSKRGVDEG